MMSKKGSSWKNPIVKMFDYNKDGKMNLAEQWLAYKVFEECTRKETSSDPFLDPDFMQAHADAFDDSFWEEDSTEDTVYAEENEEYAAEEVEDPEESEDDWRRRCKDGSCYDLDPYDFDSEEEYREALELAKLNALEEYARHRRPMNTFSWCTPQPDPPKKEIREADYPNKRQYLAACDLANKLPKNMDNQYILQSRKCCEFILSSAETITAANYLTSEGEFLYAQAIKDHFDIPVTFPDEDEKQEYPFSKCICRIAKRDIPLSFKVWEWCLEVFLPYEEYDDHAADDLTSGMIPCDLEYPETYDTEIVRYMDQHPDFMRKVVNESGRLYYGFDRIVFLALRDWLPDTALYLFKTGIKQAGNNGKMIKDLVSSLVRECIYEQELQVAQAIQNSILPIVREIRIDVVEDEIGKWENDLARYIHEALDEMMLYLSDEKAEWRETAPDGAAYGLDPFEFEEEQEYLDALNREKYAWRELFQEEDTLGLEVEQYETHSEFVKALTEAEKEKRKLEEEERQLLNLKRMQQQEQMRRQKESSNALQDDTIYTFCGVMLPGTLRAYSYRTEDPSIGIGDQVLVPAQEEEVIGRVVSVGQYMRIAAPYLVEKTKFIIRKIEKTDPDV